MGVALVFEIANYTFGGGLTKNAPFRGSWVLYWY